MPAVAEDWHQWRGDDRLGVWHETGIVDRFPTDELLVKWRVPIGSGYAGPAVADGRVFIPDWHEDPESRTLDGTERLVVLDEHTGDILWTHEWQTSYRMIRATNAIGPRATPTVDGDRVYVLGATGRLFCLDVATGDVRWETDYVEDYDTYVPPWGLSSSPLVDGDRLIALVGGEPDALVIAFDKRTGVEIWRSLHVESDVGHAQPVIYEAGGTRQLIVWHPSALSSLDPETGDVYWEQKWETQDGVTVATPVRSGDYLLVTQLYYGSLMMRLSADQPSARLLWKGSSRSYEPDETDGLHSMITTPIIMGDYVYGVGSHGELRGLDARSGERIWMSPQMTTQAPWATAFMVQHDDRFFVNNDDGDLIIAQFTPEGYVEIDRTKLINPTSESGYGTERDVNWVHPAYANRHIVQRNDNEIIRVSLAEADY
jgi:outer membrane protein assembly factor BamB